MDETVRTAMTSSLKDCMGSSNKLPQDYHLPDVRKSVLRKHSKVARSTTEKTMGLIHFKFSLSFYRAIASVQTVHTLVVHV